MKSKRLFIIIGIIFICLCLVISVGIVGFRFLQNRPPSRLTNDSGYYIRGNKVYYLGGFPSEAFEIESANASKFQIIDSQYALDDAHVYFNGGAISDASPSTFELLDSPFSRDDKHVYASGDIFSDDPANFERLGENISRDGQHIYWSGNIISDDPSHLVVIWDQNYYTYLKDSTTVFVNGNPIQGADPATFEVIIDSYTRDASHIFYFGEIIHQADTSTFEVIENPYARDAESVFWMKNIIRGADPKTFRVLNANFECSADAQFAYYQNNIIQNVDVSTLPPDVQVNNCTETELYTNP